jgi:hypothetical protein
VWVPQCGCGVSRCQWCGCRERWVWVPVCVWRVCQWVPVWVTVWVFVVPCRGLQSSSSRQSATVLVLHTGRPGDYYPFLSRRDNLSDKPTATGRHQLELEAPKFGCSLHSRAPLGAWAAYGAASLTRSGPATRTRSERLGVGRAPIASALRIQVLLSRPRPRPGAPGRPACQGPSWATGSAPTGTVSHWQAGPGTHWHCPRPGATVAAALVATEQPSFKVD